MIIEERVKAFVQLGEYIKTIPEEKFKSLAESIRIENPWFTEANLRMAVSGIGEYLDEKKLRSWLSQYPPVGRKPKVVALIMAGNIPMVGFHDLLCVLINGDAALIKSSSKDTILIKVICNKLIEIDGRFAHKITFGDQLKNFDAAIATGSDNASRYFEYYFGKYPHIIRKNRTSIAILDGTENKEQFAALGSDVFSYFGLGCRNVSKLFVPRDFDFVRLLNHWESFKDLGFHHKYHNNYQYQRSILLMSGLHFLDNGFVLLQEHEKLVSPIAVLYFEYFNNTEELSKRLDPLRDKLQCIVGNSPLADVGFGKTQCPGLADYADQMDTMKFLQGISDE